MNLRIATANAKAKAMKNINKMIRTLKRNEFYSKNDDNDDDFIGA